MNRPLSTYARPAVAGLCSLLLLVFSGGAAFAQDPSYPPPEAAPIDQAQQLSPADLDNLVAPLALYPDPLLSQVLVASTYPAEVQAAAQWLQGNRNLQGQALMEAARQQNWDASVQALVAFPDVLSRLASDVQWTTTLGNAFLAQQGDVMNAVQRMRARAQQNGVLRSTPQQNVVTDNQYGQPEIEIQPTDPQMLYVPSYNPAYVWGPPAYGYYPPLYYPDVAYGFGFFPGIYIGGFFGGIGWSNWGWYPNWYGRGIYTNAFFFNRFGYRGYYGGYRGGLWAHNPVHRLGVPYASRGLATRYGGTYGGYSRGYAGSGGYRSFGGSVNRAPSGGSYRQFGSASTPSRSYAAPNRSFSPAPSYRAPAQTYRANPSFNGGSRSFSAPRSFSNSSPGSFSNSAPRSFSNSPSRSFSNSAPRSFSNSAPRSFSNSAPRSFSNSSPRAFSGGGQSYRGNGGGSFRGSGGGGGSSSHSSGGGSHNSGGNHSGGGGHGRR
jgi:hypothetical protein